MARNPFASIGAGLARGAGNYSQLMLANRLKREADARDLAARQTLGSEAFGRQISLALARLGEVQGGADPGLQQLAGAVTDQQDAERRAGLGGTLGSLAALGGETGAGAGKALASFEDMPLRALDNMVRSLQVSAGAEATATGERAALAEQAAELQEEKRDRADALVKQALQGDMSVEEMIKSPYADALEPADIEFFKAARSASERERGRVRAESDTRSVIQRLEDMQQSGRVVTPELAASMSPRGVVIPVSEIARINGLPMEVNAFSSDDRLKAIKEAESSIDSVSGRSQYMADSEFSSFDDDPMRRVQVIATRILRNQDPTAYAASAEQGPLFPDERKQAERLVQINNAADPQELGLLLSAYKANPDKQLELGLDPGALIAAVEGRMKELVGEWGGFY